MEYEYIYVLPIRMGAEPIWILAACCSFYDNVIFLRISCFFVVIVTRMVRVMLSWRIFSYGIMEYIFF